MAGETVKIIDTRKIPSPDPKRMGKDDCIIVYETEPGVRSTFRIGAEDLNDEAVAAAIRIDVAGRQAWIGKTIQL